jgi:NAD/NADP transhydrogenase beta subunit
MPGHVPCDKLIEMEDFNGDMAMTDVALIVGAND